MQCEKDWPTVVGFEDGGRGPWGLRSVSSFKVLKNVRKQIYPCYGLNCVSPQFIWWIPNSQCDNIWKGGRWEVGWGEVVRVRSSWYDPSPWKKRHQRALYPHHCEHTWRRQLATCKLRRKPLPEPEYAGPLVSAFQAPKQWENKFL